MHFQSLHIPSPLGSLDLYLDALLDSTLGCDSEAFAKGSAVIGSLTTRVSCQGLRLEFGALHLTIISPNGLLKVLRFTARCQMPDPTPPIDQELEEQAASGFEMQRDLSRTKTDYSH